MSSFSTKNTLTLRIVAECTFFLTNFFSCPTAGQKSRELIGSRPLPPEAVGELCGRPISNSGRTTGNYDDDDENRLLVSNNLIVRYKLAVFL